MPAVIRFLGYNPLPEGKTLGERLLRRRTALGLSQKAAARELGVDPSTLAGWERDGKEPSAAHLQRVAQFLSEGGGSQARLAG